MSEREREIHKDRETEREIERKRERGRESERENEMIRQLVWFLAEDLGSLDAYRRDR